MLNETTEDGVASKVLDALPVGVFSVDSKMRINFANHTAETLLGRSIALLRDKQIEDVLSKNSDLEKLVIKALEHGGSVSARKLKIVGPTSNALEVDARAAPNHETQTVIVSLTPLHGSADEGLKGESETMAEVARILGHEVKNPLAGLLGAAQLLARQARDDQQALLSLIREEGNRIERILDRFVAFETFFSPRLCQTNVHRVLTDVMELCRASYAENIELIAQFDPSLPEIMADPDHLHEAILNLIKNSCEAISETETGNRILIRTRFRPGVRMENANGVKKRVGAYEIAISDNGPGISDDLKERVFSPFFTTREKGDGVGLAVVAEILQAHGGYIKVDNNTNSGGACFRLLLPINSEEN